MTTPATTPGTAWPWAAVLPDSRDWVASAPDPGARWLLLTAVLDRPDDDADVLAARAEVLAHPDTAELLSRLAPWDAGTPLGGHNAPAFAPNLLALLADRGLRAGDDVRIEAVLDAMLEHTDDEGRFSSFAGRRTGDPPVWGTLLCDTHAVAETLLRFGRGDDPRLGRALARMAADLADTAQGRAWGCRPDPATGFRGPGRRGDVCPQVTIEALRTLARVPVERRPLAPEEALGAARVVLGAWRDRGLAKPFMFGHGATFKTGKWPATWYSALTVLDALGRWPALWRGPGTRDADGTDGTALAADRRALTELAACLVAYTTDDDGRVVPRSVFRGFEQHSFGRKDGPSPFATAATLAVLHRLDDLAPDVAAVDVLALGSSRGGTGTPRPPAPAAKVPAGHTSTRRI